MFSIHSHVHNLFLLVDPYHEETSDYCQSEEDLTYCYFPIQTSSTSNEISFFGFTRFTRVSSEMQESQIKSASR